MIDDIELLRRYVDEGSQSSFAELVNRHLGLVYFGALRRTGDPHLAADVSQGVFIRMAREARVLRHHPVLTAWLFIATRNAAINARIAEGRRQRREQEVYLMHESFKEPSMDAERLRPLLYDAMDKLSDKDRAAVLLRFFKRQPFVDVGRTLHITEEAARKRVDRAVGKLRQTLVRRGITSTIAAMSTALAAEAASVPPAGLAGTISTATAGVTSAGSVLMTLMTWSKIELGIASAIIATVLVMGSREVRTNRALRTEINALQQDNQDAAALGTKNEQLTAALNELGRTVPEAAELTQLRIRAARPPWVQESKKMPIVSVKNAGWDTDVAALETFIWARATGNRSILADNFAWVGSAKAKADAAFAQLSDAVKAKYGSADHLAGTVLFGTGPLGIANYTWTKDGTLNNALGDNSDPIVAYWADSDPDARYPRPGNLLRIRAWAQYASGKEGPLVTDICYAGDTWTLGTSTFSDETWRNMVGQIDPETGDLLKK